MGWLWPGQFRSRRRARCERELDISFDNAPARSRSDKSGKLEATLVGYSSRQRRSFDASIAVPASL
jgi:hypothetical protein